MSAAYTYLKRASRDAVAAAAPPTDLVAGLLKDMETGGEDAARRLAAELDGFTGDPVLSRAAIEAAERHLPETLKDDIGFAIARVRTFAQHQRDSMSEFDVELIDGLVAGQRLVPVATAGCYVPGGRYAHIASAIMGACTARVAGVERVVAASPAGDDKAIHPAILYALDQAGADTVLALGGVVGVAALAFGLFTGRPADIIVGPGNRYVAEAKRLLYGRVGIDVVAGPTETLVIADGAADPLVVAADLAGQAEHGPDSPVWLVTLDRDLGQRVIELMPRVIDTLPPVARDAATAAWRDHGEVVLAANRDEACRISDDYAPEHLHVQAADLDWWLARLTNYGSLFLGEETTVAFGDKCAGPNHILPTRRGARHGGGLNVGKFIKVLTYQRATTAATAAVAPVAARISRAEGMEGHAMTADIRLDKYFPDRSYDLGERISRPLEQVGAAVAPS